ncbi:MAG TPA: hypothetical protein VH302_09415 [Bryobacteraceae bacterium]|jgi:hypothetical protein|nr:hypothetical protein [Bryobacteraceae bacterium]
MPGRGPQTFKKRQKEQERRERQQEKFAKRLQRKADRAAGITSNSDDDIDIEEQPQHEEGSEEQLQ